MKIEGFFRTGGFYHEFSKLLLQPVFRWGWCWYRFYRFSSSVQSKVMSYGMMGIFFQNFSQIFFPDGAVSTEAGSVFHCLVTFTADLQLRRWLLHWRTLEVCLHRPIQVEEEKSSFESHSPRENVPCDYHVNKNKASFPWNDVTVAVYSLRGHAYSK